MIITTKINNSYKAMKTRYIHFFILLTVGILNLYSQSADRNYIRTRTYTNETGTAYLDQIQYFDGLGRPNQLVQAGVTPTKQNLVTLQEYDAFGRESNTWLPAVVTGNNGVYIDPATVKTGSISSNGNDQSPYSQPVYEASPLNRVLEQYAPGADWKTNKKAVRTGYLTNKDKTGTITPADSLVCGLYVSTDDRKTISISKSKNYAAGELYVTRIKDEDNNVSYEFKDKLGQVVLTRQINDTEILDTYYIYDSFGNKRVVLPPILSEMMPGNSVWTDTNTDFGRYAYLYKYDDRNRCIAKKIPGADWIYYVYDKADRLVFTQDGEQRKKSEWIFTIPDVFGRTVLTGRCTGANSKTIASGTFDNNLIKAEYTGVSPNYSDKIYGYTLTIDGQPLALQGNALYLANYYDSYKFRTQVAGINDVRLSYKANETYGIRYGDDNSVTESKGLLTGTITRILDLSDAKAPICAVMYYDNKGRLIQVKSNNDLGGIEEEYFAYNFTGQSTQKQHIHSAAGKTTQTEIYKYSYDHAGRLLTTTHQLNGGTAVTLASNTYDELGRLIKNVKNNQANITTGYTYNVRSWTKSISSPLFKQTLYYNESYGGSTKQYNGNISAMDWTVSGDKTRGYAFTYDNLSRLTAANYLENAAANANYKTAYTYDKHGNMKTLQRYGKNTASGYNIVDNLTITHAGNQLLKIEDAIANISLAESADFKNYSNVATEYTYNANGAMTKDLNKGVTDIQYNLLNLPRIIDIKSPVAEARNEYTYSANGQKLKVVQKWNPNYSTAPVIGSAINTASLTQTKTTDYVGNMIYENGSLKRILIEGGYYESSTYHFYLTDHLGNNRVVANATGTVIQKNHYYPFGTAFAETSTTEQGKQPYKYNNKELDQMHGLNIYDYSARHYESTIGRFITIDPMAEKYYSISPYVYCANNPLKYIDPTGMMYDDYFNKDGDYLGTDNDPKSRKVRVMSQENWNSNKQGEKTIDPAVGRANSDLHSKSRIKNEASLKIYSYYNDTGVELKSDKGEYLMAFITSSVKNEVLGKKISVNLSEANSLGVSDNIYDIKNTFVHEGKHNLDFVQFKPSIFSDMSNQVVEERAISTQVNHSTWEYTSPRYKTHIENYANKLHVVVPGLNAPSLRTSITAPLKIK